MERIRKRTGRASFKAMIALVLVAGAGIAALTLGGGSERSEKRVTQRPASRGAPPLRFFAPTSFWNAPLPSDAPLDPASDRLAAGVAAHVVVEKEQRIGPWIQTDESSTPLYRVEPDVPKQRVKLDAGPWAAALQSVLDQGVPIPDGAKPAAGSDAHMTIYQPSTDRLWEFWRAARRADGWHASWGGAMQKVSKSPGYYTSAAWPGRAAPNWGSTATSLPVVGGTILIDELRRGVIPHALAIDIPEARKGEFAWPAQRSDGAGPSTEMPEGAHLRIDPKVDLDSLQLSPAGRVIAEAAQRYGMVVRDLTGHATAFYAEDPSPTGSNPYEGSGGLFGGKLPSEVLEGFPWDRLQVMKMTLCRRMPCTLAAGAR
jgi:hypothetical protein